MAENIEKRRMLAIENDLRSFGFTEEEILRMWLIDEGAFIVEVLKNLGGPEFFETKELFPERYKEFTKKEQEFIEKIRQNLKTYV